MQKTYTKAKLKDPKTEFSYWQTQPYETRLAALEQIRQEYHQWKYNNAQPRLQRIYTIIKR